MLKNLPDEVRTRVMDAVRNGTGPISIARFRLAGHGGAGRAPLDGGGLHLSHFLTVTVVPRFSSDSMANSSINRLTPGSPRPNPPDVE